MNRHTFLDVINDKRSSLLNDVEIDDDDDDEEEDNVNFNKLQEDVEGEEDDESDSYNKYNDIGEVMEPFNMRNERESGHIDKNMNYVFDKDNNNNENGEQDSWLADLDNEVNMEKAIGEALNAKEKIKMKQHQQKEKELKIVKKYKSKEEIKLELLYFLERGETVSNAMRRLSSSNSSSNSSKESKSKERVEENNGKLNQLIELVNAFSSSSTSASISVEEDEESEERETKEEEDIFSQSYESIQDAVIRWEYQTPDGSIQGPFTWTMMASWLSMGYFQGATTVLTRQIYPHRQRNQSSDSQTNSNHSNGNGNGKKRKNDGDNDRNNAFDDGSNINTKRRRVEFSTNKGNSVSADLNDELMADFDDDDNDNAESSKSNSNSSVTNQASANVNSLSSASSSCVLPTHGPWIRSDSLLSFLNE